MTSVGGEGSSSKDDGLTVTSLNEVDCPKMDRVEDEPAVAGPSMT